MFNELSLDANSEIMLSGLKIHTSPMNLFPTLTFMFLDKPHNPLLNSGAIMSAAMLLNVLSSEMTSSEKFKFVSDYFQV